MENHLRASANAVFRQLSFDPTGPGVPVDPDVADYMGAFEENALTLDDLADDFLLRIDQAGEVSYAD